jgi:hypothetical protein
MDMNRRNFLRGIGVTMGLPFLEAGILPVNRALAAEAGGAGLAMTADGRPLRMAFLYVPNGVNVERWYPTGNGADYQLGPSLASLAPYRDSFQIIRGLEQKHAWAGADGGGDHARASATILTGARPKKTAGSDIRVGISVDQMAVQKMGHLTRIPSLELSCDGPRKSGQCDSGYSCAYQFNISWRSESLPVAPESNPRMLFERLFGSGKGADRQRSFQLRQAREKSLLDFVLQDAAALRGELGRNDQQKLDEYLNSVRELERRIESAERFGPLPDPGMEAPSGIPSSYQEHLRLMADLTVLAFQTDSTRVSSFLFAHDGSNRSFNEVGVSDGHHNLSHHQKKAENLEKIAKIDEFYVSQFAYLLKRMRETKDGTGSLLDNSMVVYCSGLSDGDRHGHDNLPVILAGRGGGLLNPGRCLDAAEHTPMTNLYVRMLNLMGVREERFGDSTGILSSI